MSIPRYKFDPVTQRYTLLTPQEKQQAEQKEGIRSLDGGGPDSVPVGPGLSMMDPGMAEFGVGLQNFGQFAAQASPMQMVMSPAMTIGSAVAGSIGNSMMGSQVSPVANPSPMTVTAIDPVATLAAMNETVAEDVAEDAQAQAQAQAVATVAEAATDAAAAAAAAPSSDAAAAAASSATDGSGGAGGDSGAGIGPDGGGGGDGGSTAPGGQADTGAAEGGWRRGGPIMMSQGGLSSMKRYADGGMTMSPQNYGRMGDSMLVHMNPREVAGLQSLARSQGTSLTVNPQTGYPEAFNLQALLPLIAGVALGPAGVGLTAAQAGLATAALGTAATGSLKKGIMAGIGAYGGAGLGEGLIGATPGPEATIAPGSPVLAPQQPVPGIASTYPGAPAAASPNFQVGTGGLGGSVLDTTNFASPSAVAPGPGVAQSSFPVNTSVSGVTPTPDKLIGNLSGKDAFKYGTAALASIPPPEFEPPKSTAMLRPYDYSFNPTTGAYDPRPGDSSEVLYGTPTFTPGEVVPARAGGMMSSYAAGGLAAFKEGGRPKSRRLMDEKGLGGIPYYDFMGERGGNLDSVEKNFAQGGTPRFLSGGGDGMSDDIPAVIGNKQPARLADGEFVIPADVVSHIGNGSSKAGAKKLYEMMDKIRKERTGRTRQAPAIKPDRYMPA